MKASLQDFITKIFTQIKNNYGNVDNTSDEDKPISTAQQAEFNKSNSNLIDLKMLGWSVPKECPIQNYVDSNGVFHQRVGRVDLGSLDWIVDSYGFVTHVKDRLIKDTNTAYIPSFITTKSYEYDYNLKNDKTYSFSKTQTNTWIKDSSYTYATAFKNAMQGVYLYYELATEITTNIDGNEAVTKVNDSLDSQGLINKAVWNDGAINTDNGFIVAGIANSIYSDPIACKNGDRISVDYDFTVKNVYVMYYNGSTYLSRDTFVAPTNATHFRVNIRSNNAISKSSARVYVNNSIDELKNDLAKLFSSNITGIKLNGSTLEVSFNNGTSVGKVSFEGIAEEETIIS